MPWPRVTMNESRLEFVRRAQLEGANIAQLCAEYGIARKTGYKWLRRAKEDGLRGLRERSRRPHRSAKQLDETTICELGKLKVAHPRWGPKKIRALYGRIHGHAPSLSSCHRVLRKLGLVEPRKRRMKRHGPVIVTKVVPRAPNDLWTTDFKGWWRALNRDRCEPLTVVDAYSKYVLATVLLPRTGFEAVKEVFERLFQMYGLPRAIRSDNGSPFACTRAPLGLTQLSAWWASLGIDLVRGRPGCPQDNGAHERMHGDIAAEIAAYVQPDRLAQQAALDVWRRDFNEVRPHEALGERSPAAVYRKSSRKYQSGPVAYGPGFLLRKVAPNGRIAWNSGTVFVTSAIAGHDVGLKLIADGRYDVWFYHLRLGIFDPHTCLFQVAPSCDLEQARVSA